MASSMTGFGHAECTEGSKRVTVEIKSVNHRYLDLSVKTSRSINSLEAEIRNYIRPQLQRGKIDVYVHYHESGDDTYSVRYNERIAEAYVRNVSEMAEAFGLCDDMTVSKLASLPDVFELVPEERDDESRFELIRRTLDDAMKAFFESRNREGENLKQDLLEKLKRMEQLVGEIEKYGPDIIEEYKEKLKKKVSEFLEDRQLDEGRIAAEVTIYADKICVDEEIVRLNSHIRDMENTLCGTEAAGRKLDFIAQEMNREANTILSKSTDARIADIGIELKTLIEKVREQIQNIE